MTDPYLELQVDPTATAAEIDAAYRRLSRHYRGGAVSARDARAQLERLAAAYQAVSDPVRRTALATADQGDAQHSEESGTRLPPSTTRQAKPKGEKSSRPTTSAGTAVRHPFRWAVAFAALAAVVGSLFAISLKSRSDAFDESLRVAITEYAQLEQQATAALDASLLSSRATGAWLARRAQDYSEVQRRGLKVTSRFVDLRFKGFRRTNENRTEADLVAVWSTSIVSSDGRVLQAEEARDVPQTVTLLREEGRWKFHDVRFYESGKVPF
ncbi:MAG: J domain-containing protein [Chloroflexota bacterium]